ncbi:MAG: hypothetical protein M1817_004871 [Caeruleum heppii]|nr:MAG: hypothetical protein M1817_004871 [Caeruleum heppii]
MAPVAPTGTFAAGTKIQVGTHKVVIDRYLSEGGFAHVYLVKLPQPIGGADVAVLKRVAVPDKDALANMRTEVETMKKLKGHRHIVTYIDSHASQLKGSGYEVFLLMEYCAGGGLIDFMNTRLQNRLTEPEALRIFSDVAEGVACMHYLRPPLLHRDLKVENVLISSKSSSRRYKLCDFGSTAPPRPAATSAAECRLIEDDVQKHTTLQYRSPEMIDVYRKQPIDEKSDIWALGVLLYKLCYYTTPFEEQGQLAILNASFKFPAYPRFSDPLKKLIASMLREDPKMRPNIYQVVREACAMLGVEVPIKDIYAGRTQSEARRHQKLPSPEPAIASPPMIGAIQAAPLVQPQVIPSIVPMRRGRPGTSAPHAPSTSIKPGVSPGRTATDPFAALDARADTASSQASKDELSTRFPTLDQFSLLHETGAKFDFDQSSPLDPTQGRDISQRITEHLADEAFALPAPVAPVSPEIAPLGQRGQDLRAPRPPSGSINATRRQSPERKSSTKRPTMVSQGTMTSPPSSDGVRGIRREPSNEINRLYPPPLIRSSSHPRSDGFSGARPVSGTLAPTSDPYNASNRPGTATSDGSKSPSGALRGSPASSRPSLEGKRPSSLEISDLLGRSSSTNSRPRPRPRPSSSYVNAHRQDLADRESSQDRSSYPNPRRSTRGHSGDITSSDRDESDGVQETTIADNVDFLRAMEDQEGNKRKEKRSSSGSKHSKRASMPSISLSNTKTLLAGKFGDAFRRFEGSQMAPPARTPSPTDDHRKTDLAPIEGSQGTGGHSDDEKLAESEELPPEVRRELERRSLAQEERRVEAAAAEYRRRVAHRGEGGAITAGTRRTPVATARATSIQNKVKTLLDENSQASPTKAVSGQGQRSDGIGQRQDRPLESRQPQELPPRISSLQGPASHTVGARPTAKRNAMPLHFHNNGRLRGRDSDIRRSSQEAPAHRPSTPRKPDKLRTVGPSEQSGRRSPTKPAFLAGRPVESPKPLNGGNDDWEADFSKRYPSLSKFDVVETPIEKRQAVELRSKEV